MKDLHRRETKMQSAHPAYQSRARGLGGRTQWTQITFSAAENNVIVGTREWSGSLLQNGRKRLTPWAMVCRRRLAG